MSEADLPDAPRDGVVRVERVSYRGKHYRLPIIDAADPVVLKAHPERSDVAASPDERVLRDLHSRWDVAKFMEPRMPVSLGVLSADELAVFPWQDLDGKPLPPGAPKTKPRLRAGA